MNVHQVITGALNRAASSFAVGSVEGINFTVTSFLLCPLLYARQWNCRHARWAATW